MNVQTIWSLFWPWSVILILGWVIFEQHRLINTLKTLTDLMRENIRLLTLKIERLESERSDYSQN